MPWHSPSTCLGAALHALSPTLSPGRPPPPGNARFHCRCFAIVRSVVLWRVSRAEETALGIFGVVDIDNSPHDVARTDLNWGWEWCLESRDDLRHSIPGTAIVDPRNPCAGDDSVMAGWQPRRCQIGFQARVYGQGCGMRWHQRHRVCRPSLLAGRVWVAADGDHCWLGGWRDRWLSGRRGLDQKSHAP
jgi:hypothetical protein